MALIRDQDIALTWEVRPGITVRGNRDLLSRMLTNLVSNGYRYGKPGGHIRVSLGRTGGGIELAVADDGIGIAPEEQEKIFRRFYQSDSSRSGAGHRPGPLHGPGNRPVPRRRDPPGERSGAGEYLYLLSPGKKFAALMFL